MNRLTQQIAFLRELDELKNIIRQTSLANGTRKENTAEHSWHVAMAALVLSEHADEPVDVVRVVKMLLVHDIVEIDAGDTYAYDETGNEDKPEREQAAAKRIYGLLPDGQGEEYHALWQEFEDALTPDSHFANAIDQILPLLHNIWNDGMSWQEHQPTYEQIFSRTERRISGGSASLWDYAQRLLDESDYLKQKQ